MDEQLRVLARLAADGGAITMQVLPFDVGAHVARGGRFGGDLAVRPVT